MLFYFNREEKIKLSALLPKKENFDLHCRYLFNSSIAYKNDIYPVKKKKTKITLACYIHKTKQPKDFYSREVLSNTSTSWMIKHECCDIFSMMQYTIMV